MPWVEALELEREKEREREREKAEAEAGVDAGVERRGGASLPKVDLQPRKMGDSYSRGVSILFWFGLFCALSLLTYFDDVFLIDGCDLERVGFFFSFSFLSFFFEIGLLGQI